MATRAEKREIKRKIKNEVKEFLKIQERCFSSYFSFTGMW